MNKFKRVVIIVLSIIALILIIYGYNCSKNKSQNKKLSDNQIKWIHDIEQLRGIIKDNTGISYRLSDEKREKKIDSIIKYIKKKDPSDTDMYLKISELFSDIEIAHLTLKAKNIKSSKMTVDKEGFIIDGLIYPIGGRWFGDDFYIVNVLEENTDVAGGVLKAINGVPMEEILKRFDKIIVNETNAGLKNIFQKYNNYGFFKIFLEYLGIAKAKTTTFTIYKDGIEMNIELEAISCNNMGNKKFKCTLEDIEDEMQPMWHKVYNKSKKQPFIYEHDMVNNAIYFQYNSCVDSTSTHLGSYREGLPNFQQFFDEMIYYMQCNQGSYNQFIIDLRYNTGGDYYLLRDAIDKHMDFLRTQNIKVLIGYNYSAGHMAVEDILRISSYIKIYGEESSSAVKNYTEITNSNFELDNSKWVIQLPMMEDFRDNLKNRQTDWNKGIIPDYYIYQTYGDYMTGIDTVYTYALMN